MRPTWFAYLMLVCMAAAVIWCAGGCSDDDPGPASPGNETADVNADGSGRYSTIQQAVDEAADGDVITLSDGAFFGDGNRDVNLRGKAITIRSLSGDPTACIIDCQADVDSTHRAFVFDHGEGSTTILSGIGIRNGNVLKLAVPGGGGILCANGSSPVVENVRFVGNAAAGGGGLACLDASSPDVVNCWFEDNYAHFQAGGIYCSDGSSATISDTVFLNNYAYDMGGAIYCRKSSAAEIANSLFEGNVSRYGGSVTCMFESSVNVTSSHFKNNSSWEADGGAVYGSFGCAMNLTSCVFEGNSAPERGGAVSCGGNSVLSQCIFVNNSAGQVGGAVYLMEAAAVEYCTFRGNATGDDGGTVYCEWMPPEVGSSISITNTIIAGSTSGGSLKCWTSVVPTITCTDIFGNVGGDWVETIADQLGVRGNISVDPLFCTNNPEGSGYWILPIDSPCAAANCPCGGMGAELVGCGG